MEEVYFALGMAVIIQVLTIMIVYTLKTKLGHLEIELQYLERGSQDVAVDLHRRIDNEVRELQSIIDKNERDILTLLDSRERDVISQLDSRLDRLTSKINKQQLSKG